MKAMTQLDNNAIINVSKRMELDAIMKAANLKDAAVRVKQVWILTLLFSFMFRPLTFSLWQMVKLAITSKDDAFCVQELDVLRSREIVHRHSGKYGSVCLVVRRPG
jgi:hypothetical protein